MPSDPAPEARAGTLVLGVLGGIASGKSEVARLLAGADGQVVDADALAREELDAPEVAAKVREAFGDAALGADGRPDREHLARVVFADPAARARLERWIHPGVRARIRAALARARAEGVPRVVLDVPLLLENDDQHGLAEACDALVYVDAPLATRDARARERRGWEPGEVARREAAQLPQDEKRARADQIVVNDEGIEELRARVREVLAALEAGA